MISLNAVTMVKRVGILALQGSVDEHAAMVRNCGHRVVLVRRPEELVGIDALILPGGESTTMGKLLHSQGLYDPMKKMIEGGLPTYGTCAGMILLAREIIGNETVHFGVLDIAVKRNAYGAQLDSMIVDGMMDGVSEEVIPMVFIRAPWIESAAPDVQTWNHDGHVVAARKGNILVTSFHPELTSDSRVHQWFLSSFG